MGYFGRIAIKMPKTDLYTTTISWKLNLSSDYSYFITTSNMDYEQRGPVFNLHKPLTTVDDETLYFKTSYRKTTIRFWASLLAFVLTLITLWFYKRRNDNPSIRERVVAAAFLLLFVLLIIFLKLPLTVIAVTALIVLLLSYLFAAGTKVQNT